MVQKSISQVKVNPLTEQQKADIRKSLGQLSAKKAEKEQVQQFFQALQTMVINYLNEYTNAWNNMNKVLEVENSVDKALAEGKSKEQAYQSYKKKQMDEQVIENFIKVLMKGKYLLEYIRQQLTGQNIRTKVYLFDDKQEKVAVVNQEEIPYHLVLSTYKASGNNYFSLAMELQNTANQVIEELENQQQANQDKITNNGYKHLQELKQALLNNGTYHKIYFDSTDAEILEFYRKNPNRKIDKLKAQRYLELRKQFGRRPNATQYYQIGDIGDTQVKAIKGNNKQVNIMRMTMIKRIFEELRDAFKIKDKGKLQEVILKNFSANDNNLDFQIDKTFNKTAKRKIQEIFDVLDGIP